MSTFNFKNPRGYTPGPPLKRGTGGERRREGVEGGKGGEPPQFTFLATPLHQTTYAECSAYST